MFYPSFYPWPPSLSKRLQTLKTPEQIQAFLDKAAYNIGPAPHKPADVLKKREAHCFDGAVFAASLLERGGDPPLILDLRAVRDDDHVIAVFRRRRCFGAVAKSNYTGLRFREPVYRTLRELVMSYFESYFNLKREKTLREFSRPFDLRSVRGIDWLRDSHDVFDRIAEQLDDSRHYRIMRASEERIVRLTDMRTFRAGKLGRRT